jgi:hypothetical protein
MAEEITGTDPKESPVLETPAATETPAVDHRAQAEALLETLGKLSIETPEKLQNVAYASQQAGRYANDLGTSRNEVEALKAEMAAIRAAQSQPQQHYQQQPQQYEGYDYTPQPTAPSITPQQIESIVGQQVNQAIGRYTQGQLSANQAVLNEYAGIQSDPEYGMVQSVWDRHVSNPRVQLAIQSGQTSLTQEFNRTKVAFYKGIAMNARETMTGLLAQSPRGATPPHIEQSTTQTYGMSQPETHIDRLQEVHSKSTGTDDDLDAMLKAVLPDDDLFLQPPHEIKEGVQRRR